MRFILLITLALLPLVSPKTASVEITGDVTSRYDGFATVQAFDGFAVMALTTHAPPWGEIEEPFEMAEVRIFQGLAPGSVVIGRDVSLTYMHWNAEGEQAWSLFAEEGTLRIDSVRADTAYGALSASLSGYAEDGTEQTAQLEAVFAAAPGEIPSP